MSRASLEVDGLRIAAMEQGLLAFVGVARADTALDARNLAAKLVHLRIFEDSEGKMNRSLLEVGGSLGLVPQFTLLGDARKGRRPAFHEAAPPEHAEPLLEALAEAARVEGAPVVTGRFRARMEVALVNEGPVTILLDTARLF